MERTFQNSGWHAFYRVLLYKRPPAMDPNFSQNYSPKSATLFDRIPSGWCFWRFHVYIFILRIIFFELTIQFNLFFYFILFNDSVNHANNYCLTAELRKGHFVGRRGNTFAAFRILMKTCKVHFNFKSFFKNWMSSTIIDISLLFLSLLHLKIKEGTSLCDFVYSSLIQTKTNWWRFFILK